MTCDSIQQLAHSYITQMPQKELGKYWLPTVMKQDQGKLLQHKSYKHAVKMIFAFRGNNAGIKCEEQWDDAAFSVEICP